MVPEGQSARQGIVWPGTADGNTTPPLIVCAHTHTWIRRGRSVALAKPAGTPRTWRCGAARASPRGLTQHAATCRREGPPRGPPAPAPRAPRPARPGRCGCARSACRGRTGSPPRASTIAGCGTSAPRGPAWAGAGLSPGSRSSSSTSWAVSTSFAPSRRSLWQPLENGEWMEPGIANTSRPCSPASRAVISEPDERVASTTSTPFARPLISRLRRGKFCRSGGVPGRNSDSSTPDSAITCASSWWRAGYTRSSPVPDAGDGRPLAPQRAFVCGGVHAQRQARDDREPGAGQGLGEGARILAALRRRLAAADDGERRAREQLAAPHEEQDRRRLGRLQQRGRIVGVVPGEELVPGLGEPGAQPVEHGAFRGREQAIGRGLRAGGGELGARRPEQGRGTAEALEQRTEGRGRQLRDGDARPGFQAVVERHGPGREPPARGRRPRGQGLRTRSPTRTGSVLLTSRA